MTHILETERTKLIPFRRKDVALFHSINTDPFVRKFMWDNDIIPLPVAEEIIATNERFFAQNDYGIWKIHLTGRNTVIGYAGLWFFFDEAQPQLIYALLKPYTRKGYATECAGRVLEYAFDGLGFEYVLAATDEPHRESQKVAKRLGMRFSEKRIENNKSTMFYRIEKGEFIERKMRKQQKELEEEKFQQEREEELQQQMDE